MSCSYLTIEPFSSFQFIPDDKMAKLLGICVLLSFLTGVTAESCIATLYYSSGYDYYIECDNGCCGYYYAQECCASPVGTIVGAVIGCIIFIVCIVVFIIVIKSCNKKRTGVIVAGQTGGPGNVTVVNTANQQQMQQQPYGAYPQPAYPPPPQYGGQPQPYPQPQPAYGGPPQTY
ncbi:uncharacterized protein LOC110449734 [Mizuhopecten yessoensis]|uniref:uncharacterized protein LOC110449734 n=1 Tax=Mizuhopecten yessoensis TaxID=6573 RepID=UPI000B45F0A9|nr:uncharacterized protein LOC110449734 [Mizuhopecten yessoensis]